MNRNVLLVKRTALSVASLFHSFGEGETSFLVTSLVSKSGTTALLLLTASVVTDLYVLA